MRRDRLVMVKANHLLVLLFTLLPQAEQKALKRRKRQTTVDQDDRSTISYTGEVIERHISLCLHCVFLPFGCSFRRCRNRISSSFPTVFREVLHRWNKVCSARRTFNGSNTFNCCITIESNLVKLLLIDHRDLKSTVTNPLAREGLPWNPSMHAITFLQKLNSHSVPLIRLLAFFKQIPEFNQLNVDDKVTLIKFNLLPLLCINCTLSYKIETDQIVETESDVPWDSSIIQEVYGYDGYLQMRKIFESFVNIARYDRRIIQLFLITLILTKGVSTGDVEMEPILNDGLAVYRAQNYYTELLWKYIETVHGPEKAVSICSKLFTHFITWQTLHKRLRDNVERNLLSTDINELLPLMKTLFHIT